MKLPSQLLPAASINRVKWDDCVRKHSNGLIYAQSAYLDAMCHNWHGWVLGDYAAVWPIPWRKKFGIRYTFTPSFIQQLGIIGEYNDTIWRTAIRDLHAFVSYGDVHFNFGNSHAIEMRDTIKKRNLVIDLNKHIEQLRSQYRTDTRNNITKAGSHTLQYQKTDITAAVTSFRTQYGNRMKNITAAAYESFAQLCLQYERQYACITRAAVAASGEIQAVVLLLKDERRLYNLMNTTLPEGRKNFANHWLLDQVIKEFAEEKLLLDLEGSELPGVRQFYEGFGAVEQPYFHYHFNRMPFPFWLFR
jgi:ribosomal protein S24E